MKEILADGKAEPFRTVRRQSRAEMPKAQNNGEPISPRWAKGFFWGQ